jgi:hypothetical protein
MAERKRKRARRAEASDERPVAEQATADELGASSDVASSDGPTPEGHDEGHEEEHDEGHDGPPPEADEPSRAARLFVWLRDTYCVVDLRTAAVFRIALGVLLALDLLRRLRDARWLYTNEGVLPNWLYLSRVRVGHLFSAHLAFSTPGEVWALFAVSFLVFVALALGLYTRVMSVAAFVLTTSLGARSILTENGGYLALNLLVGWGMFLPLGERFGVDALVRSYRERREASVAELSASRDAPRAVGPHVSLIGLLVTLNVAVIYFFNTVNKSGVLWRSGDTVHFVLHLDRMITGLVVPMREHLPPGALKVASWLTLVVEAVLAPLILAPKGRRVTRPLAMLLMVGLHGTFGVLMRLGPFSWFMISWSLLLLTPEVWTELARLGRRLGQPVTLRLDERSPLALALGRLVARLDVLALVTFEPLPPRGEGEAARAPFEVRSRGELVRGRRATWALARALPAGLPLTALASVLTLGAFPSLLGLVATRAAQVERFFGLPRAPSLAPQAEPSPLSTRLARGLTLVREAVLALMGVTAVFQALHENKSIPKVARPDVPGVLQPVSAYPRMFQGWGMFSSNPVTDDGILAVDAITIDGRHVDPLLGAPPSLDLVDAGGVGMSQLRQDYYNRIRLDRNRGLRQGLQDYLLRHHERTGRPSDELVAFDVYWVRDLCPPPGSTLPWNQERLAILTYRKSGHRPAGGLPPLPHEPPVVKADSIYRSSETSGDDD